MVSFDAVATFIRIQEHVQTHTFYEANSKNMMVNRRTALKHFVFITGGAIFLPSCLQKDGTASVPLKHLKINKEEENLLAEMTGTIIPATDTPGAKEMNAHLYLLKMVDDCYEKEAQQDFEQGMGEFNKICKKRFNQSFTACTTAQREELLNGIEQKKYQGKVADFYKTVKRLTLDAYLNSQFVMTKLIPYELVPGRWHGCVPATKQSTKFI
ncbi:MAG: gluconate 2-dehydrogenase subunit 3 family protein [Flavisolibacter sp.]|nr:gluconate 2-dehydrogenase subunit 3 family protein [Flavisolibacter sp.]